MVDENTMVQVELDGPAGFRVTGQARSHTIVLDEPAALGGDDAGPTPVEALLAALGACTAMTLRMYALRKGWPLGSVRVTLVHRQLSREECPECPADPDFPKVDRIGRSIEVSGELDPDQLARLLDVANRCPVHRMLTRRPVVVTEIAPIQGTVAEDGSAQ